MSRARHHRRLRLHLPVSGKFFLIPRFPLHYNSFATVAINYNSLDTIAVNYNSFVPRTRLLLGRLTGLSQWAGPAGSSSARTGSVKPSLAQRKKQKQLWPGNANLFWAKDVFDKTHFYTNSFYFIPPCFNIRLNEPFVISENWYLTKHTQSNCLVYVYQTENLRIFCDGCFMWY
jgi:hypothetical protein